MGGHVSVVQLLVTRGADVMVADRDSVNMLMSAASQGHFELTKMLLQLDCKSTINTAATSGGTALMFASAAGYV